MCGSTANSSCMRGERAAASREGGFRLQTGHIKSVKGTALQHGM
jgi:hypothetical protein